MKLRRGTDIKNFQSIDLVDQGVETAKYSLAYALHIPGKANLADSMSVYFLHKGKTGTADAFGWRSTGRRQSNLSRGIPIIIWPALGSSLSSRHEHALNYVSLVK